LAPDHGCGRNVLRLFSVSPAVSTHARANGPAGQRWLSPRLIELSHRSRRHRQRRELREQDEENRLSIVWPLDMRDVAEFEEAALQASLERLAEADLLFVEGAPPAANYRFKHALIQDAAYDSLLKSRSQALPRRGNPARRSRPRGHRAGANCASFHRGQTRRPRD
jgi:hypothetical protein